MTSPKAKVFSYLYYLWPGLNSRLVLHATMYVYEGGHPVMTNEMVLGVHVF
jgi:hypothetical protein